MRLAFHTDFSLRMLIYLQLNSGRWVSAREVAESYGVSVHHMVKIGKELTQMGLLAAKSGRGGGLQLEESAGQIRLGDLVKRLENHQAVLPCVDEKGDCVIRPACQLKNILKDASSAFYHSLNQYQLKDLRHQAEELIPLLSQASGGTNSEQNIG